MFSTSARCRATFTADLNAAQPASGRPPDVGVTCTSVLLVLECREDVQPRRVSGGKDCGEHSGDDRESDERCGDAYGTASFRSSSGLPIPVR
jgi:hypothetical protein